MTATDEWSLPPLILMSLSLYFFLPCPIEEGSDSVTLVGMWHPARVSPPQFYRQNCWMGLNVLKQRVLGGRFPNQGVSSKHQAYLHSLHNQMSFQLPVHFSKSSFWAASFFVRDFHAVISDSDACTTFGKFSHPYDSGISKWLNLENPSKTSFPFLWSDIMFLGHSYFYYRTA